MYPLFQVTDTTDDLAPQSSATRHAGKRSGLTVSTL
jgi:hypothetical protein